MLLNSSLDGLQHQRRSLMDEGPSWCCTESGYFAKRWPLHVNFINWQFFWIIQFLKKHLEKEKSDKIFWNLYMIMVLVNKKKVLVWKYQCYQFAVRLPPSGCECWQLKKKEKRQISADVINYYNTFFFISMARLIILQNSRNYLKNRIYIYIYIMKFIYWTNIFFLFSSYFRINAAIIRFNKIYICKTMLI